MSTDPFANTTTVKNILQHILSPKIVNDGAGGFVTKTDLVNIDTVKVRRVETDSLTFGTISGSFNNVFNNPGSTYQCGIVATEASGDPVIYSATVSSSSITILATVLITPAGTSLLPTDWYCVNTANGSFTITSSRVLNFNWFIPAF